MPEPQECGRIPAGIMPIGLRPRSPAGAAFCAIVESHRAERTAGAILKLEGEGTDRVYFVLSGWLATSKSTVEGHRQILDVLLPGGLLDPSSADADTSAIEIAALTDTSLAAIHRDPWSLLLGRHPEIARAVNRAAMAAMSRITGRMLRLGRGSAQSVVAYALCELCLRSSPQGLVDGGAFHIPMTQQQLGDLCGLSAVHICRTLRRLRRNGVLTVADHMTITVQDVDALAAIAEIDPEALRREIIPAA